MKKTIVLVLALLAGGHTLSAEENPANSIGIEPTYTYKGGLNETVNLFNGNLNVQVPLVSLKGRAGLDLNVTLSYNSRQFKFYPPATNEIGWNYAGPNMGRWVGNFYPYVKEWSEWWESDQAYYYFAEATLETGSRISFIAGPGSYPHGTSQNSEGMEYNFDSKVLSIKSSGTTYDFKNYQRPRKRDANGNYIDWVFENYPKLSQIVDSLGRTINFYYDDPNLTGSPQPWLLPTRMTLLNHAGAVQTYSFEYQYLPIQPSSYGYNAFPEWVVANNVWVLTRINLPDGKAWSFTYYPGYPGPSGVHLKQIDYPMGGYTRYEYQMWSPGGYGSNTPLDLSLWKKIVNANNGQGEITTTYTCTAYAWVYNPDGSKEHHVMYDGAPESFLSVYNASDTQIRGEYKQWTLVADGNKLTYKETKSGTNTWTVDQFIYDQLEGTLITQYTRGAASNPYYTQQPFYQRKTTWTYQKILVTRPGQQKQDTLLLRLEETVEDQNRTDWSYTLVSKTRNSYDQFALTNRTGTIAGHETANYGMSFTTRGNVTTVEKWLKSENRWIAVNRFYYDILGNVLETKDARNYSTHTSYSPDYQYAYLTQSINAKGHSTWWSYKLNTGHVASSTDSNSRTTSATYDSLNRVTQIDYPDGGYTRAAYDLTANNFSTTVYKSVAAGQESAVTTYLDGIGRVKTKKTSDPAGDIYRDTEYSICDCQGRTAKVSNPYRLGETVYWTETQYDGLGRKIKVIPPDGTGSSNHLTYQYELNSPTMTVTDAAGKSKKYEYDMMMRIWRVTEPDSTGQLTQVTTYNYLPSTTQPGMTINQGVQSRTSYYDTLGRTVSEIHPENGTTVYAYDDAGNMTQRTDARGWITNFTYDEINRMTGKTYQNDGGVTPAVTLVYDAGTNGIGRLSSWSTGPTILGSRSYDSMGRTLAEYLGIDGVTHPMVYEYGLGGQVLTREGPDGSGLTYGYDSVGNLETITSTLLGGIVTNIDRNAAGAWTLVHYGNGVDNTRTFNTGLQLASIRISTGATTHFHKAYGYNAGTANNGRSYRSRTIWTRQNRSPTLTTR